VVKGPGDPAHAAQPQQGAPGAAAPAAVDVDRTIPVPPPIHVEPPRHVPGVGAGQPGAQPGGYTPLVGQAYAPGPVGPAPAVAARGGYGPGGYGPAGQGAQPPHQVRPPQPGPVVVGQGYNAAPFANAPAGHRPPLGSSVADDNDVTIEPATRHKNHAATDDDKPLTTFGELKLIFKDFLKKNEKVIWWLHTAYALSLGAFVATFAQKGFERARMLTLSLAAAWLLVVFFFRFFGTGTKQDFMTAWPGMRRRFFVMTYLMKNLFQGMLFFLLPFYWKSSSVEAKTYTVVGFLAACAILSTLDLVFDRVLFRSKLMASLFYGLTLFGCANLVIPALLPNTPILVTYLVATGLSIATFFLFHVPFSTLKKPIAAGAFGAVIVLGVLFAYSARRAMPPVPLTLKEAGVGPSLREDGSLSMEIRTLRTGEVGDLFAVTDVQVVGNAEHFKHVWRHDKKVLSHETAEAAPASGKGVVRVASRLPKGELPSDPEGKYTVDVLTDGEQIVGRVVFEIKP
jgi:hypothetical protein